jgi:hypothetical protein
MFKAEVPYKVVGQVTGLDSMTDPVLLLTQRLRKFWLELFNKESRERYASGFEPWLPPAPQTDTLPKRPLIAVNLKPILGSPSTCVHLYSNSDLAWLIVYALVAYCMTHGLH